MIRNMKLMRLLSALVLLSACSAIKPNNDTTMPLQGTWTCLSAIVDGKPLPDQTVSLLRLTLTKDRYKTEKGAEVLFDSTYSIDGTKTPKQIDMIGTEGALTG